VAHVIFYSIYRIKVPIFFSAFTHYFDFCAFFVKLRYAQLFSSHIMWWKIYLMWWRIYLHIDTSQCASPCSLYSHVEACTATLKPVQPIRGLYSHFEVCTATSVKLRPHNIVNIKSRINSYMTMFQRRQCRRS
jgi:hypothetical protein